MTATTRICIIRSTTYWIGEKDKCPLDKAPM
jgi:hypothetical protein